MKRISKKLIDKSTDAFVLSIEIFNKPTIKYRIEGFSFFFVNSWELLNKAKIIEDTKKDLSIYYKKRKGQPRKSLSLRDCLKKNFENENDPIRLNIEKIGEIRDSGTHFLIDELEAVYSGLFQSGVINYLETIKTWFDFDLQNKFTPGMLSLVGDLKNIDPAHLKREYGKEIMQFVIREVKDIDKRQKIHSDNRFMIPIDYRLVLSKTSKAGDIELTKSDAGSGNAQGVIVEVPKDPNRTHPFRQGEIEKKVKKDLDLLDFNRRAIQAVIWKEKIKGNSRFHFKHEKSPTHQYSAAIVDLIKTRLKSNPDYIEETKGKYTEMIKNKSKRRKNSAKYI
jgi:hypothetical protein